MARFLACTGRFCAVLLLCAGTFAFGQSSSTQNPSSASGWSNPTRVFTSNNQRATQGVFLLGGGTLTASQFGFSIPPDHSIDGIVVEIERSQAGLLAAANVTLTGSAGTVEIKQGGVWPETSDEAYETFGSSTDKWGVTWTPTGINNRAFGVEVEAVAAGIGTLQIDHIRITVYHSLAILPIRLASFDAELTSPGFVSITWSTASEINNDYFTIERSVDGEQYEPLGNVSGSGTTNTPRHYAYEDRMPLPERSYYRLKQTDYDGVFTFSSVVLVDNDNRPVPVLTVLPNPSDGTMVGIRLTGLTGIGAIPVTIHAPAGRLVATCTLVSQGESTLEEWWNLGTQLPPGLYVVRAGPLVEQLIVR